MTTSTIRGKAPGPVARARASGVGSVLISWDLAAALVLGVGAGSAPALSHAISKSGQTILVAFGAAPATLAALTLTGTGMLLSAITPAYRAILQQLPHGEPGVLRPFLVIVRIAGIASVVGFAAALVWPLVQLHSNAAWPVFSVASFMMTWALFGFVQTVTTQLPMHMRYASEAESMDERKRRAKRSA